MKVPSRIRSLQKYPTHIFLFASYWALNVRHKIFITTHIHSVNLLGQLNLLLIFANAIYQNHVIFPAINYSFLVTSNVRPFKRLQIFLKYLTLYIISKEFFPGVTFDRRFKYLAIISPRICRYWYVIMKINDVFFFSLTNDNVT